MFFFNKVQSVAFQIQSYWFLACLDRLQSLSKILKLQGFSFCFNAKDVLIVEVD